MLRGLGYALLVVVVFSIIGFAINSAGYASLKFWGPKREEVRREIYEETKSFNESKKQELIKYKLEYSRAEIDEKGAIATAIRMSFADYDESKLEPELAEFLREIKYGN